MWVELTLDPEAGRATVLKTAWSLFQAAPACPTIRRLSSILRPGCSTVGSGVPPFVLVRRQKWRQNRREASAFPRYLLSSEATQTVSRTFHLVRFPKVLRTFRGAAGSSEARVRFAWQPAR